MGPSPALGGGPGRARTGGLLVANQALSQLSYGPAPAAARPGGRPWGPDGWETLRWEADLFFGPSRGRSLERR